MQKHNLFTRLIELPQKPVPCSCGSKELIMYACRDPSCPSCISQPFYCKVCAEKTEAPHHPHSVCPLLSPIETFKKDWYNTKKLIGDLLASDSVKWIEMHLPLFRLFEKAATKKK